MTISNEELRGEVGVLKTENDGLKVENNGLKMENAQLNAENQHLKVWLDCESRRNVMLLYNNNLIM